MVWGWHGCCAVGGFSGILVWGDMDLLHFYPRNWQAGFSRSGSSILLYLTTWQHWLWFTFIFLINLYFIFLLRIFTYRRAGIRGRRATGDKRRTTWPEIFTCFLPFVWCINVLSCTLFMLRSLELHGGSSSITVQVSGFQWGWRYGYGESTYMDLLGCSINVGWNSSLQVQNGAGLDSTGVGDEVYFSRLFLRSVGSLTSGSGAGIDSVTYRSGFWITSQGLLSSLITTWVDAGSMGVEVVEDPLRLFRVTSSLVLPSQLLVRIMATAEDVIHSWAVPGLGVKLDCVPGRLFISFLNIIREGVYYGQCSELCGWNHYNMPISVYALPIEHFLSWWELEVYLVFSEEAADLGGNYSLLSLKYK